MGRFCLHIFGQIKLDVSILQVSMGKLKSLVNKFLAVNRLHGLVIVPILTLDPIFGSLVPLDSKNFYCRSVEVVLFYLSLNFWANNITIALIRSSCSI